MAKAYLVGSGISGTGRGDVPDPRRRLRGFRHPPVRGTPDHRRQPGRGRHAGRRIQHARRTDVRGRVPLHLRPAVRDPHPRRPRRLRDRGDPGRARGLRLGRHRPARRRERQDHRHDLDGILRARPAGAGPLPGHTRGAPGRQTDHRLLRRALLHHQLLVHVVHHVRLPALAQRDRVPPLPEALHPSVPRLRHHVGHPPHPLQPVRLHRSAPDRLAPSSAASPCTRAAESPTSASPRASEAARSRPST